jgi:predicted alpha/beta superfamily hydrolase
VKATYSSLLRLYFTRNAVLLLLLLLVLQGCTQPQKENVEIKKYPAFPSSYVKPRNVEVMLPPGYDASKKYDVLYMHDGQNVFDAQSAFAGGEWGVDEVAAQLIKEKKIRPVIVVASWCTENRFAEYMPNKPGSTIQRAAANGTLKEKLLSDEYLKFLVYELKPFVDKSFSTYGTPEHTFIMGSSMGGLISCYAVCEYPQVFGGAACLSTHWPALNGSFLDYVKTNLPSPKNHKIYFDYGTVTLDSLYEPYQQKADRMMEAAGYQKENNWITRKFEGAEHNEKAWHERVHIPLEFLLKK